MSTYVIGDLQGCFVTLQSLLQKIRFAPKKDTLWFVGDLVNRGEGSLECLRFVRSLGTKTVVTLGNHDLHLLAVAEGFAKHRPLDTLLPVLDAPDADDLLHWLRQQKLLHIANDFAMVHAGLMPQWSWQLAATLAREVEQALQGRQYRHLLQNMYGNEPSIWQPNLQGMARQRFVINVMTRMRAISNEGAIDLKYKGELDKVPTGLTPWFSVPTVRRSSRITLAGHWSALGLARRDDTADKFIGLDTGCIWGGALTAFRLDDRKIFQVPCAERNTPEVGE